MDTPEPEEPGTLPVSSAGGAYWARWEYTPEEWQLFDQWDWGRAVRSFEKFMRDSARVYAILAVGLTLLLLILRITGVMSSVSPLVFGVEILAVAAGQLVLVLLYVVVIGALPLLSIWKRHRARWQEPRQVTIGNMLSSGNQAIWVGAQYVPLQNTFLRLSLVLLYEDIYRDTDEERYPPMLDFNRRLGPLNIDTICVLVPHGHEEEARRLVERFKEETIPAKQRRRETSTQRNARG